jgi:hypothetical protein
LVGCSHVGCSKQAPFRIEPEVGQVPEDFGEPKAEMPAYVLQHDEAGSQTAYGISNSRPEVSVIVGSFSFACMAERLARVARADQVDGFH